MAELVGVLGVTHNPLMWSLLDDPPEDLAPIADEVDRYRGFVSEMSPDVLVVVGSDHFHFLFTDNMPAFMIGKAERMRAGFPNEKRVFGLDPAELAGEPDLARSLLEPGGSFDFAFSDEPWLDHAFLVPLLLLTPDLDIPVVPIFANTTAPPIPSAQRFADLGRLLSAAIHNHPTDQRVVIVGSGHLAHELGGPRQFLGHSPSPEFDEMALGWMSDGDIEGAVSFCTTDGLGAAGNETYQFLNYLTCLAAAGRGATEARAVETRFGALPFFSWSIE